MDTKDRIKREQNQHIGLICCNIHELTYAMHEFNNGKYDETRTKEVIDEISTMTKEIGWPVVVMDTLEYSTTGDGRRPQRNWCLLVD